MADAREHPVPASLRIIISAISKMDEQRVLMCTASLVAVIFSSTIAINDPAAISRIVENSGAVWAAALGAPALMYVRALDKNARVNFPSKEDFEKLAK